MASEPHSDEGFREDLQLLEQSVERCRSILGKLAALIGLRWRAVAGRSAAILVGAFGFGMRFPILAASGSWRLRLLSISRVEAQSPRLATQAFFVSRKRDVQLLSFRRPLRLTRFFRPGRPPIT